MLELLYEICLILNKIYIKKNLIKVMCQWDSRGPRLKLYNDFPKQICRLKAKSIFKLLSDT